MIELSRSTDNAPPVVRIVGVGGAGCNVLDRLVLDGIDSVSVVAVNSDVQALNASVVPDKILIGQEATRGLGTGGDPELGYTAAEEGSGEIETAIAGANLVFIIAGLGGGTGSGASPLIAHHARRSGAVVIAFVTMPFTFEGRRRRVQAEEALEQIREQANLVMCFENDRMGEASSPTAGVQQAFIAADHMMSASVRAITSMVRHRGLIGVSLADLTVALRQRDSRCLFGHGESDGGNRAHEALERALKSPLLEKGRVLGDSHSILIHVTAGPDVTLNEINVLMTDFHRRVSDSTLIQFGLSTDSKLGKKLAVTIVSSTTARPITAPAVAPAESPVVALPPARPAPAPVPHSESSPAPETLPEPETLFDMEPAAKPAAARMEPVTPVHVTPAAPAAAPVETPRSIPPQKAQPAPKTQPAPARTAPAKVAAKATPEPAKREQKAEQMPLEAPSRGRFDKGEPTIVDGEDLDVPTFMRRNVKLK